MSRRRITLFEPHRVKSVWQRGSDAQILGTVRSRTPLHSQPIIAAKLREKLQDRLEIKIVDSRLAEPVTEERYKSVHYGSGVLHHYRVGLSLDDKRFRDFARETDLLGLTVNFTQEAGVAMELAQRAKALNPQLRIIYGGSDVRARPDHYLTRGCGEAAVLGDGELCGPQLLEAMLDGKPLATVPSIAYRDSAGIHRQPGRATVAMEEVPLPAFDIVQDQIEWWTESHEGDLPHGVCPPLAYVETSRGCHETCPYCYSAGLKYRMMGPEQLDSYARYLKKWGIRSLMMIADNELTPLLMQKVRAFGMPGRDFLLERFRIFRRYGLPWEFSNGLQYSMFVHGGHLDEELIEGMFDGCYRLFTPIEDPLDLPYPKLLGTPLDRRHSTATNEQNFRRLHLDVLARIAATGLPMMTFGLIVGWPGDTIERVRRVGERCRMLKEAIQRANAQCAVLFTPFIGIPIPGTQNWFDYQRRGLITEDILVHPEAWQFALTAYGNFEMIDERLRLIADLNGEQALKEWTSTGHYPHQTAGQRASAVASQAGEPK